MALSVSSPLGFHLLYTHARFALAVLLTHFALLQASAPVVCFAQVTLNTIALGLGVDLQVSHVIDKLNPFITEVFKRDFVVFEVWSKLAIPLLSLNDTTFTTENKVLTSRPSTSLLADNISLRPWLS